MTVTNSRPKHLDTLLEHYATNESKGTHDLKQLAQLLLGADPYAYKDVKNLEQLHYYNALDCAYTFQIHQLLEPQLHGKPLLDSLYYDILLPASDFLMEVEDYGMLVDPSKKDEVNTKLLGQELAAESKCVEIAAEYWGDTPFNPNSVPDVTYLIYRQLGLKCPDRRVPQNTEKKTLLLLPDHPFITALLELRGVKKLRSTYVTGLAKLINPTTRRIHSSYLLHGTVNGRLSSKDPNTQNIPRVGPIKDMFVPAPGFALMESDYSQAELRTLAHLSADPDLIKVYTDGRDLHTEVSIALFQDFLTRYNSPSKEIYDIAYEQRTMSKTINFGIMYGRGPYAIANTFHISIEEATKLVDGWFERFPKAYQYILRLREAPARGEIVITPFGRRRRMHMVTLDTLNTAQNEMCNFPISSTASDLNLIAAMRAQPQLRKVNAHIINLVHDSILTECPDDPATLQYVADVLKHELETVPQETIRSRVPFTAEVKVGRRWGELSPLPAYLQQFHGTALLT